VPVTEKNRPNPYLDDPLRDLKTHRGISLTMINPAFMTRQIAEIAAKDNGIQFHITSLNPIRPGNKAFDWEADWLESFNKSAKEQGRFLRVGSDISFFYMAPLLTKKSCLKCHARHGYKEGDIRGGISFILPFFEKPGYLSLIIGYGVAGMIGILVILVSGHLLQVSRIKLIVAKDSLEEEVNERRRSEDEQKKLVVSLQKALAEIKTLHGIVPICSHCKKIRDDKGFWNKVETFVARHTEVKFSHGICPECIKKHYSDIFPNKDD